VSLVVAQLAGNDTQERRLAVGVLPDDAGDLTQAEGKIKGAELKQGFCVSLGDSEPCKGDFARARTVLQVFLDSVISLRSLADQPLTMALPVIEDDAIQECDHLAAGVTSAALQ
jgi:hypothetical protein